MKKFKINILFPPTFIVAKKFPYDQLRKKNDNKNIKTISACRSEHSK